MNKHERATWIKNFIDTRLKCNVATGEVRWGDGRRKGKSAGTVMRASSNWTFYRKIDASLGAGTPTRISIYVHRIVWYSSTGRLPNLIDHINGDGLDNRISNLRECTRSQNTCNSRVRADNKVGLKGVQKARSGRYWSRISLDGKDQYLGTFDTPEEAHAAYCKAAVKLHGEFARTS